MFQRAKIYYKYPLIILTKMIAENELATFKELFDVYYPSLLIYAYQKVNDKETAKDMVQDVFLSLWIHKKQIDFNLPLQPYLFRAVHNQCLNYLRSRHVALSVGGQQASLLLHREIVQYNQHDTLLLNELADEIALFIQTLPAQCRKIFRLSRQSGLKNKEIAELLGISEKTVEGHLSKALRELRVHLVKAGLLSFLLFLLLKTILYYFQLIY